jgi:hypothetical protein
VINAREFKTKEIWHGAFEEREAEAPDEKGDGGVEEIAEE